MRGFRSILFDGASAEIGALPIAAAGLAGLTASFTEADDTIVATGSALIQGAVSATETNDTPSATSAVLVQTALLATEANDTLVATGVIGSIVTGSLAVTEVTDTLLSSGVVLVQGVVSQAEADDTGLLTGTAPVQATLLATEANDTLIGRIGEQAQQQIRGGGGSRGLLDLDTDAHIRAVDELHEARLKQRQAEESPAPIADAPGQAQPEQLEQPKPAKKRKRKSKSAVLPADVIAGGLEGKQPAKVEPKPAKVVRLPARVEQVEAADSVNDDEFAIVLAQFLLAA